MKLNILVFAAHPDDAELGCGGTILKHVSLGMKVGIVDFTKGELGTRGTPELRKAEAEASGKILGIVARENLEFRDGFFRNDETHQLRVIQALRKYQPEIILASAVHDRHPDHGRAAQLVTESFFLSGLEKVVTKEDGKEQKPWRPKKIFHYIQSQAIQPDFIVDISGFWERKIEAIRAFKSQMFDPNSKEPETYISTPLFLEMVQSRAKDLGHGIGVSYGEGFTVQRVPGIKDLNDIL